MSLLMPQLRSAKLSLILGVSSGLSLMMLGVFPGGSVLAFSSTSQSEAMNRFGNLSYFADADEPLPLDPVPEDSLIPSSSTPDTEDAVETQPEESTPTLEPPAQPGLPETEEFAPEEQPEQRPPNLPESPDVDNIAPPSLPPQPSIPLPSQHSPSFTIPGSSLDSLMPAPQAPPSFEAYRLGPGDSFFVNVRRFPELSFQATLDIQGNVIVPLQGILSLQGLTLQEAESLLTQVYNQYVVNPEVSLTLVAQRGVEVTIVGEVVRPGFYPLTSPQISTALLSAGGTTRQADLRQIQIQRRGTPQPEVVDLFTPLKEGQEIPDVALQDGDVIVVERRDPSALDEYDPDLVARSTLAQPLITIRLLNYGARGGGSLTALELPNGSRFADALVRIGLSTDASNLSKIGLVRFDEEAGQAITTTLNGREAFQGNPSENPPLQTNDVIIVNRSVLARVTYALSTFTQPFRDVLGFLLFFDSLSDSADNLFGP
ncbi:MAG: polysaccharide biosynthesis/export family protein [Cyanobacteria bacterium P01_H01_bin.58]